MRLPGTESAQQLKQQTSDSNNSTVIEVDALP
jgi:hypothetical protein